MHQNQNAPDQQRIYPPCKGMNCGATDGVSHSPECRAEHAAAVAGGRFVKGDAQAPAGLTEREQFIWRLGHSAASDANAQPVASVTISKPGDSVTGIVFMALNEYGRATLGKGKHELFAHPEYSNAKLIADLQRALAYWMPKVFDEHSANDTYLLYGYEGDGEESAGEAAWKDAERYRWLRDYANAKGTTNETIIFSFNDGVRAYGLHGENADAIIDAALKQSGSRDD